MAHCWVFQICWHIEWSTLTTSSFRIWNSSTGIPSPPLALFIVMLPKTHFTSHSRMSVSRWMITTSWLSGSWRSFLYSSSVHSCHLFWKSSASVRPIPFLSFIEPIFAWNVPLVSNFIEEICCLPHPILFLYFFSLITEEVFLITPWILWNSAFKWVYLSSSPLPLLLFFSQLFVRHPQTTILPFCISFLGEWSWSLSPVQCH